MTYEEASDAIKTWAGPMRKAHQGNEFANEFIDCAVFMTSSVVREAVEKQISKKPKPHEDDEFSAKCPNCYDEVDTHWVHGGIFYCPNCGQSLNWDCIE